MATTQHPIILGDDEVLDPFAQLPTGMVTTARLRPGMILVDQELGCPSAVLDHRIGSHQGGLVEWLIQDVDSGSWVRTTFAVSRIPNVPVAVA